MHDEEAWWDEWEIPAHVTARCDWCGKVACDCDDATFDADELGLDPEEDDTRGKEKC